LSDVILPDGSTLKDVPDGTTKTQIIEKLHKAGNPNWEVMARSIPHEDSHARFLTHSIGEPLAALVSGVFPAAEPLAALASGAVAAPVAGIAGLGSAATGLGDPASVVEKTQSALSYQPRTQGGQEALSAATYPLRKLAEGADYAGEKTSEFTGSPLAGAAVNTLIQSAPAVLTRGAGAGTEGAEAAAQAAAKSAAAAARAAHFVEHNTGLKWSELSSSTKAMMTSIAEDAKNLEHLDPKATERVLRAKSQGVPMTRGQATRNLAQLTSEEALKKSKSGQPLMDISAQQDEALFKNLETLKKDVAPKSKVETPQQAGAPIQTALRRKMSVLEADVKRKYAAAEKAGESAAPVDLTPLEQWLNVPVNKRNAGFLKSAIEDYKKDASGSVSINNLEEIRKEAVANAMGPRSPATHYAGEAISIIDKILDQSGGSVYKEARAAHRAVKEEFDRQGAIRKLVGSKGATDDRAIALEDTLETTVVRGSNEDLLKVKKSLLEGGTEATRRRGEKAWADLQAGAISYLYDKAGGKRQIRGEKDQQQFNGPFLDGLHDLDRDGKLSTLFGDHVAKRVRTFADTVHDVRTTPTGRIAGSDSVPRILNLLEKASHVPGIGPIGAGLIKKGTELYQSGKEGRNVREATTTPLEEAGAKKRSQPLDPSTKRNLRGAAVGDAQAQADEDLRNYASGPSELEQLTR
jgi:hypothetical protein